MRVVAVVSDFWVRYTRPFILRSYVPSQADVAVFKCLEGPPASKLHHALRWYNHIASYSAEEHLA